MRQDVSQRGHVAMFRFGVLLPVPLDHEHGLLVGLVGH